MPNRFAIGQPIPRARDAYASREKWRGWILASDGHGDEWERVFRAGPSDAGAIWLAIVREIRTAPLATMRDRQAHGVLCGVVVRVTVNRRTARVVTAWHYEHGNAAPRLVTAYPVP